MSMLVKPVCWRCCQSSARQQPGEPVMESPSGIIRIGVAACALGTTAIAKAITVAKTANTARTAGLLSIETPRTAYGCGEGQLTLGVPMGFPHIQTGDILELKDAL